MARRPNFILIITDQHRADYLGCYGHPLLRTPNIDGLARRGTRFERFYVASPICMPNRSTLMTGRMPSAHGVRHNGIPLSQSATTFVEVLREQGYATGLVGKSHLQNMTVAPPGYGPADPPPDFARPGATLAEARKPVVSDVSYAQEHPDSWADGGDPIRPPFYGFDHVRLVTLHGDRCGGHYAQWLERQHPGSASLRGADNALPHDYVCPQAWRTAVPEELYPTTYVEREAISFLEQRAAADDPFFLQVSFPDPHHPFTPPGKFWDLYDPADVTLPESFLDVTNQPPPHVEWARAQRDAGTAVRNLPSCFAVTEREAREAIALSCGMITMIDDAVGRILAGLSRFGLADDTVIMFTTDHGDFLGDHQMLLKGPMHYQGLVRVPFIWCDPANAAAGDRRDDLSGTVDIAPTILERAKIVPFNGIQGQSLFAADSAGTDTGRDALLIEEDGQRAYLGFDLPVRCRTLVTEGHRLTIYHGVDWGELYDLDADPGEMVNLWDDPGHARIQSELTERLARALMATDDRSPYPTNLA